MEVHAADRPFVFLEAVDDGADTVVPPRQARKKGG
jgi:hypothetical protein